MQTMMFEDVPFIRQPCTSFAASSLIGSASDARNFRPHHHFSPPHRLVSSPGAEACRVRTYIKGLLLYLPSFPKATQTFLHLHLHLHLHLSALFNTRTCNRSHRRDPSYSPLFTSFLLLLPSHRCLRVTAYSSSTSLHTSAIESSHYKRKSCRPLLCCSATPVSCLDTLRPRITNYEY